MKGSRFRMLLLLGDIVLIFLGFHISFFVRFFYFHNSYSIFIKIFYIFVIIHIFSFSIFKNYSLKVISSFELFKRVFLGNGLAIMLCFVFLYIFREILGKFPTSVLLLAFIVNNFLLDILRPFIYYINGRIKKDIIFVSENNFSELLKKIKSGIEEIDEIVITSLFKDNKKLYFLIKLLEIKNIKLSTLPALYDKYIMLKIENIIPAKISYYSNFNFNTESLIRIIDFYISLFLIFFFLPLFIIIAFLIKIDSKGKILYIQERVGKDGQIFYLYKFRTMVEDAEMKTGPVWASKDDRRITKVGRVLRRTRLDELPQLFNVIKGDMSLVGPRPERPYFVKRHKALQGIRLSVRPGITGFAQVRGSYDLKPVHKLKYDYLYIQKRSIFLNIYILLKTLPVVLTRKGW